jgi:hypothetical protein
VPNAGDTDRYDPNDVVHRFAPTKTVGPSTLVSSSTSWWISGVSPREYAESQNTLAQTQRTTRPAKLETVVPTQTEFVICDQSIETAFGFLKSKGFDLESTRLKKPDRIQRMMGVLSVCLLWGLLVGHHLQRQKATVIKKHGQRAISGFRRGLDHLHHLFANAEEKAQQLKFVTRLLVSCS